MFKKIYLPAILALLTALLAAGAALAAPPEPNLARRGLRGLGQVVSWTPTSLTIRTRNGPLTFQLDADTRFRTPEGDATPEDLRPDQWVAVIALRTPGSDPRARAVLLFPAGFDPAERLGAHARGQITALAPATSSFTLLTLQNETLTVHTDATTFFGGELSAYADLAVGMNLVLTGHTQDDGALLALVIAHTPRLAEKGFALAGRVTAVDPAAETFTLETRRGESFTLLVTPDTIFKSRGGAVQSLEDLEVGMRLASLANPDGTGALQATRVLVGRP